MPLLLNGSHHLSSSPARKLLLSPFRPVQAAAGRISLPSLLSLQCMRLALQTACIIVHIGSVRAFITKTFTLDFCRTDAFWKTGLGSEVNMFSILWKMYIYFKSLFHAMWPNSPPPWAARESCLLHPGVRFFARLNHIWTEGPVPVPYSLAPVCII